MLGNGSFLDHFSANMQSAFRPNDDEGYQELAQRLLMCLEGDQVGKNRAKIRKHPSVDRLVVRREMGLLRNTCNFGRNALRSLVLSKNRSYVLSETHDARGLLNVEGSLLIAHKARKVYNIDIMKPLCRLDMLEGNEKIMATMWIELAVDLEKGSSHCSPYWLIILTQNRLLCIDPLRQILVAEFLLPSDCCRFSGLAPNDLGRTFCLYGKGIPPQSRLDENRRVNAINDMIIGLFNIYPLKFKGLFRITKEVFGNFTNVSVISDMVIVFKKKPYEIVLYNLIDFQNHTEDGLYEEENWINGKAVLPRPTLIRSEPLMCSRVVGNWSTLEYSGVPYHILGVPWSSKGSYLLVDAVKMSKPASLPFSLRVQENTSLQMEESSMLFHSDETGRILRFEGPAIVSYNMEKSLEGAVSFQEVWRTNLWVHENFFQERFERYVKITSRFGRHIKPTSDFVQDYRLVIKGVDIDVDCQIIAVITECDLHSPVFDNLNQSFDALVRRNVYMNEVDMCTVIFLLDDATGAIVKIAMMREPVKEGTDLHFDMCGVLMCFNQRGQRKSFLEVHRLQEHGVMEWEQSEQDQCESHENKFDSSVRRQTRRRTRSVVQEDSSENIRSVMPYALAVNSRRSFRNGVPRQVINHMESSDITWEFVPVERRRRRLRIVYFDDTDSSDSDYLPGQ